MIELDRLTKSFLMGKETIHALAGVSATIQEGELLSIIGASGSGKSTLMNILGLLDVPDTGEYRLEGRAISGLSDDERARLRNQKIGFVFQSFNLLARASALRNVEMPLVYSASYDQSYSEAKQKELAQEALDRVKLADRMHHRPNELSGGQRQRVAIARAIVNKPKILLADEPTGALDSKTGLEILSLFEQLNTEGVTIILVTHDPKVAARAHRVISMSDGHVTEDRRADS
ncbi:MAG: ABC transporter ATP-binding protein [Bdellovibrionales bacterium]|nr:ABC transporter ATP-binding protein [Bdellovibrionales bacterium]